MTVVLDANVLIGALNAHDVHHAGARAWFRRWRDERVPRVVSAVNYAEALVAVAADAALLRQARSLYKDFEVTVQPASEVLAVDAARRRARHQISVADGFLLATAEQLRSPVATFDAKLRSAARAEGLEVLEP